jgi:DNA-binding NarL/FixJ family response regulator
VTGPAAPRVIVAEDGILLREGLAELLRRVGFDVVDTARDAEELVTKVFAAQPDLVLTDVRMPPGFSDEGLRAAVGLRDRFDALPVVALSQYVERSYADKLLNSCGGHAVGYLLKDRVVDIPAFAQVLRTVLAGGTVVDPEVVRQLIRQPDPVSGLSPRELEVLALIAEGHSNSAMAAQLYLSEASIAKHIGNIFTKLDIAQSSDTNRRVLAVLAYLRA